MSFDTVDDQQAFAAEHGFAYRLLSDADKQVGTAYEVLRSEGDPYFEYGIPKRITYLIRPGGEIARSYVLEGHQDLTGHAGEVLSDLRELQAQG